MELHLRTKINRREFGHGDIITYDKYNGVEMYITDEDILPVGDGFIYTVQLVNNDNYKYLDAKYLTNGTKIFRKGSARGEYGERFSDITTRTGFREFYNFVGGAEAHVHYSISSRADLMIKGGLNADGTVPVTEIWRNFNQDQNNPSVSSIEELVAGAVELPEGVEMVMPGDNLQMTVTLIAPIAMEEGLRFAIREGGRAVGAGVVANTIE